MSKELYSTSALHRFVPYDARAEIISCVGDLSNVELWGTQLIVAPYVHSGLLRGRDDGDAQVSIADLCERYRNGSGLLASRMSTESIYQGKVNLILKIGTEVDVEDPRYGDTPLRVGDWVYTLQENTRGISIAAPGARQSAVLQALGVDYLGWPCKLVFSADLYGRVDDPNILA